VRAIIAAALGLLITTPALADGPGTRFRTGPGPAQPIGPIERDAQRCDALQGQAKERCMRELRAAMAGPQRAPHEGPGPEAIGGTSAGSGGTTGGPTFGAPAPR
jgi:hypothetical protein